MIDKEEIEKRFTYRTPKKGQTQKYNELRSTAKSLANDINEKCPDSREKSLALTALEDCIFWANASIARNE